MGGAISNLESDIDQQLDAQIAFGVGAVVSIGAANYYWLQKPILSIPADQNSLIVVVVSGVLGGLVVQKAYKWSQQTNIVTST